MGDYSIPICARTANKLVLPCWYIFIEWMMNDDEGVVFILEFRIAFAIESINGVFSVFFFRKIVEWNIDRIDCEYSRAIFHFFPFPGLPARNHDIDVSSENGHS